MTEIDLYLANREHHIYGCSHPSINRGYLLENYGNESKFLDFVKSLLDNSFILLTKGKESTSSEENFTDFLFEFFEKI